MAGEGYTVRATVLEAGGRQAASLQGECEQVASALAAELETLAVSAGNPAVTSGAQRVAKSSVEQFLNAAAGYQYSSLSLGQAAAAYSQAEARAASSVHGVAFRLAG